MKESYPDVEIDETDAVWDVLKSIYNADNTARFIFILDEWDYIFHRDFVTDDDRAAYIDFLSNLLKGKLCLSDIYDGHIADCKIFQWFRTEYVL